MTKTCYYPMLEIAMKNHDISKTDMVKVMGKSIATLNRRFAGKSEFSFSEVEDICNAYGFNSEIFVPITHRKPALYVIKTIGNNDFDLIYIDTYLHERIEKLKEDPAEKIECLSSQGIDKYNIFKGFESTQYA